MGFFWEGGGLFVCGFFGGGGVRGWLFFCVSVHLKEKKHPHKHKINSPRCIRFTTEDCMFFFKFFLLKGPRHDLRSKFYTKFLCLKLLTCAF